MELEEQQARIVELEEQLERMNAALEESEQLNSELHADNTRLVDRCARKTVTGSNVF